MLLDKVYTVGYVKINL